ncbi:MAG: AAA family ATPase [Ruminiclostridium sp.]|nr:AAA family ATPase [Ruminiclostridium sp.]
MDIYEYYKRIASIEGLKPPEIIVEDDEEIEQMPEPGNFAMDDVFNDERYGWDCNNAGDLVKMFFGFGRPVREPERYCAEDIKNNLIEGYNTPNGSQLTAIGNAMNYPVSIVQGPPGTGKTDTIIQLLNVISRLEPGAKTAIVSTNNEALTNILSMIEAFSDLPDMRELYRKIVFPGSASKRREYIKDLTNNFEKHGLESPERSGELFCAQRQFTRKFLAKDRDIKVQFCNSEHLDEFPFVLSTIHSLHMIYGPENIPGGLHPFARFDYVIVDECSQVNMFLGLAAMNRAGRHLVLFGDDNQLSPIVKAEKTGAATEEFLAEHPELERYRYDERSFLQRCNEEFVERYHYPSTLLKVHYRCHPDIIGFCNEYVYDGELDLTGCEYRRRESGEFPVRIIWYSGSYFESVPRQRRDGELKTERCNRKQVEVFMEDWRTWLRPLMDEHEENGGRPLSVGVLSPYKGIVDEVRTRLENEDVPLDEDRAEDEMKDIPCLTIHKAQGKGYDIVYLLNGEDFYCDPNLPWSQKRRMINVAVSRAKKKFVLITASQWLPDEYCRKNNVYKPANYSFDEKALAPENAETSDDLFVAKLTDHVYKTNPDAFRRSPTVSVFDDTLKYRFRLHTQSNFIGGVLPYEEITELHPSAPEYCMAGMLSSVSGDHTKAISEEYDVYYQVPLQFISPDEPITFDEDETDLEKYYRNKNTSADFVICEKNTDRVILAIEVDGNIHRVFMTFWGSELLTEEEKKEKLCSIQENDKKKNRIFEKYPDKELLLRLPSDGSTFGEEETIRDLLNRNRDSSVYLHFPEGHDRSSFKKLLARLKEMGR